MTQSEFFGAIKSNLDVLAQERVPLPLHNLPGRDWATVSFLRGIFRIRKVLELETAKRMPDNVRVWDLVGSRMGGGRPLKFRVFACFSDDANQEGCREAKFALRKWYQSSGLTHGHDLPYSGVLVVGTSGIIANGRKPAGEDIPDFVTFEMWAGSRMGSDYPEVRTFGSQDTIGERIVHAVTPETFDSCSDRVKREVDACLRDPSFTGFVTVRKIADRTGVCDKVVSSMFYDLMGSGEYSTRERKPSPGVPATKAELCYIEHKAPGFWEKLDAKRRGKWYVQEGPRAVAAFSLTGLCLWLLEKTAIKNVSQFLPSVLDHSWLLIVLALAGAIAVTGFGLGIFRKK